MSAPAICAWISVMTWGMAGRSLMPFRIRSRGGSSAEEAAAAGGGIGGMTGDGGAGASPPAERQRLQVKRTFLPAGMTPS